MPVGLRYSEQKADRLHRQLCGNVDEKVTREGGRVKESLHSAAQFHFECPHSSGRQALRHQSSDSRMPWVVHHVQDDARDGKILNDGSAVRASSACLRGERHRIAEHLKHFVVCGDRPETLAVGSVDGRLVPPHRRSLPVGTEELVREAVGEGVEVSEVDLGEVPRHVAILTARSAWVKNGVPGV